MEDTSYQGEELALFAKAINWKRYLSSFVMPHLGKDILEVGAGIGATTKVLCQNDIHDWTCLEPDGALLARIQESIEAHEFPSFCRARGGTIHDLDKYTLFDTILYIDVLEHIPNDANELECACSHLRSGGKLVVSAPAYSWLFSAFDNAIGHQRRYNVHALTRIVPSAMHPLKVIYIDSAGVMLSAANRILLKQGYPSEKQIALWDRLIIPLSRQMDKLAGYRFGKTIFGVWQKK